MGSPGRGCSHYSAAPLAAQATYAVRRGRACALAGDYLAHWARAHQTCEEHRGRAAPTRPRLGPPGQPGDLGTSGGGALACPRRLGCEQTGQPTTDAFGSDPSPSSALNGPQPPGAHQTCASRSAVGRGSGRPLSRGLFGASRRVHQTCEDAVRPRAARLKPALVASDFFGSPRSQDIRGFLTYLAEPNFLS